MNIHEYQAKALLKRHGAPVAPGYPATTLDEAANAANKLAGSTIVVKSQIHAGGRGKGHFTHNPDSGGGVRITNSVDQAIQAAKDMLANTLVTHQTGPVGKKVQCVYLEQGADIANELYLSMLVDRKVGKIALVVSQDGGMDIEDVAARTPERIHTLHIEPQNGVSSDIANTMCTRLGLEGQARTDGMQLAKILYKAFTGNDMSLLEINPLVVSSNGKLMVMDAKMSFDDNALFRHPDIACLKDENEEDQREKKGAQWDLAYIALDGNIGCMVNGAGLAMATMDIIKLHGASPANFCDVGGGASREKVAAAFRIILEDSSVKGILVNIFGGIMKCDVIADGIIQAIRETRLEVPLVVRLEGTNAEQGKATISHSGLNVIAANDLDDAARKIVQAIAA